MGNLNIINFYLKNEFISNRSYLPIIKFFRIIRSFPRVYSISTEIGAE